MKWLLLPILLVLALHSSPSKAADMHIFVSARNNFSGVGSARLGIGDWEFGQYNPFTLGFTKMFPVGSLYYTSFGFGMVRGSPGFIGNIGFDWSVFWVLSLRGELVAVQAVNGESNGVGTLGLAVHF